MVAVGANGDCADRNLNAFTSPDSIESNPKVHEYISASGTL